MAVFTTGSPTLRAFLVSKDPDWDDGCVDISCTDGSQNGTETDVDCGGLCDANCAVGDDCEFNGDCASNRCNSGRCAI